MGTLSTDLKDLGYERTERESPFDERGELWTNSYELVCDETGFVIRKDEKKWKKVNGHLELKERFKYDKNEEGDTDADADDGASDGD